MKEDIQEAHGARPLHIRNAPTGLMANLGYGKGYQYAHDAPDALVAQDHPEALSGRIYYRPTDRGAERDVALRLEMAAMAKTRRNPERARIGAFKKREPRPGGLIQENHEQEASRRDRLRRTLGRA